MIMTHDPNGGDSCRFADMLCLLNTNLTLAGVLLGLLPSIIMLLVIIVTRFLVYCGTLSGGSSTS